MAKTETSKPINIETERFLLRSLTADDISPEWIAWLDDPEVLDTLNTKPRHHTKESLARQLSQYDNWKHYQIGIFTQGEEHHIGLHEMNLNRNKGLMQVNVMLGDKAWWGKGVVAETRNALLDHFFLDQGIEKAYGTPLARNYRMIFNYKNQGWVVDKVLEGSATCHKTGHRIDQYRFVMTRERWAKLRGRKT